MKKYLYMYRKLQAFLTTNYNNSLMDDSLSLSLVWQAQFWCWPHTRTTLEKSHEQTQGMLFPVAASG